MTVTCNETENLITDLTMRNNIDNNSNMNASSSMIFVHFHIYPKALIFS